MIGRQGRTGWTRSGGGYSVENFTNRSSPVYNVRRSSMTQVLLSDELQMTRSEVDKSTNAVVVRFENSAVAANLHCKRHYNSYIHIDCARSACKYLV